MFRLASEPVVQSYESNSILFGLQVPQHQQATFMQQHSVHSLHNQTSLMNTSPGLISQTTAQHVHSLQHHEQPMAIQPPTASNITIQPLSTSNAPSSIALENIISSNENISNNLTAEPEQTITPVEDQQSTNNEQTVETTENQETEAAAALDSQEAVATDAEQADDERSASNEKDLVQEEELQEQEQEASEEPVVEVVEDKTPKSYLDILRKHSTVPAPAPSTNRVVRQVRPTVQETAKENEAAKSTNEKSNHNSSASSADEGATRERNTASAPVKKPLFTAYVKNLPENPTAQELVKLFSVYGKVVRVDLHDSRAFCFVKFAANESLLKAVEASQQVEYKGQKLQVEQRAVFKNDNNGFYANGKNAGGKSKNNKQQKDAGNDASNGKSGKPYPKEKKDNFKQRQPKPNGKPAAEHTSK